MAHGNRDGGLAFERHATREHFVEDDADGVEVGGWSDRQAAGLLGREVLSRTDNRAGLRHLGIAGTGNAKVGHFDLAVGLDEDVLRLDVAVDHALLMRDAEGSQDLERNGDRPPGLDRRLAANQVLQRLAFDVLLDDVRHACGLRLVVDLDDVRVVQARCCAGFALEALDEVGIVAVTIGQHLDGDLAMQRFVLRKKNARHATLAKAADDAVAPIKEGAGRGVVHVAQCCSIGDCLTLSAQSAPVARPQRSVRPRRRRFRRRLRPAQRRQNERPQPAQNR